MQTFIATSTTIFLSILLQALPFMLLGSLISSILHVFVSDKYVIKVFPSKNGLGFFTALFGGLIFPVCECASVPVVSGLMKKGVAMPIAVTFMLAAPILNPISIMSTIYAFPDMPKVAFFRIIFGVITSGAIGILLLWYPKSKYLKENDAYSTVSDINSNIDSKKEISDDNAEVQEHCCCCGHLHNDETFSFIQKMVSMFLHSGEEFFSAGRYLIIGALITAIIRTSVPSDFFTKFTSGNSNPGVIIMMFFAFIFSACSTSDAFIARSFYGNFSLFSIMGFLVFGPMLDVKNIFMLLSFFKKRFVVELSIIITIINFIFITALGFIFL